MAGDYAKIKRSITSDLRFRALDPLSKLVYTWVLYQPKLSPCGALDLIPRRMATEIGVSTDELIECIDDLVEQNYLLEDRETSEIAVRTYVLHDVNTGNANMVKAVWNAISQISSPRLRGEIKANLPVDMPPDPRPEKHHSDSVPTPSEESSKSVRSSLSLSPIPHPQPAAAADAVRTALSLVADDITAAEVRRRQHTKDRIRIPSKHQAKVLLRLEAERWDEALSLAEQGFEPCVIAQKLTEETAGRPLGCVECEFRGVRPFDLEDPESECIPCPNCNLAEAL